MLPVNGITTVPAAAPGEGGGNALGVGTFSGRVVDSGGALSVRVGAVQLPLPEGAPFTAGQRVHVSKPTPNAAVEVRPVPVPPPMNGTSALTATLSRVLAALQPGAGHAPESVAPLVPQSVPLTPTQVQQLIALFVVRGALGPNLTAIAAQLETALAAGWKAPEWAASLIRMAGAQPDAEPDAIAGWLKQAYRGASGTAEANLAAGSPEKAFDGLLAQLRGLRGDASLRAVLESANWWTAFASQVDGAVERLEGRALQQLHGLAGGYAFAELPAPFQDFSSIHVHWFRRGAVEGAEADQVVLDVSASRLGDLWVSIQTGAGHCRCVLRATAEDAVRALESERGALQDALRDSGYENVSVTVDRWDGDRLTAAARLMGRAAGLDADA